MEHTIKEIKCLESIWNAKDAFEEKKTNVVFTRLRYYSLAFVWQAFAALCRMPVSRNCFVLVFSFTLRVSQSFF